MSTTKVNVWREAMNNEFDLKGKTVITTGLYTDDEQYVKEKVESFGGIFKANFVKTVDVLVINTEYFVSQYETNKIKKAKELIELGKNVTFITFDEFRAFLSDGNASDKFPYISQGFHIDNCKLIKYVPSPGNTDVVVPNCVNEIEQEAFQGCKIIRKVEIPESVISLGGWAFAGCESLEEVELSEGIREIGNAAFGDCRKLKSITLPESVEVLGPQVFAGCVMLRSIKLPERLKKIDWNTFYGCEALEEVAIGSNVKVIERKAFSNCRSLTSISLPEQLYVIPEEAFQNCEKLQEIVIPEGVASIKQRAFDGCTRLRNVSLGTSINEISLEAFKNCESLKEIKLPDNLRKIRGGIFEGCTSLEKVSIPEKVSSIEDGAFSECKNLKYIDIPESVNVIEGSAFYDISASAFTRYENGLYLKQFDNPYYWFVSPADYDANLCEISHEAVKIANDSLQYCGDIKEIRIPKNIEKLTTSISSGVKRMVIYDNLKNVMKILEYPQAGFFQLIVKSSETDDILSVIPVHSEILETVRGGWLKNNGFSFQRLDRQYDKVKNKEAQVDIAVTRLKYPIQLEKQYKNRYLSCLNKHSKPVIMQAIDDGDLALVTLMGKNGLIKKASIKAYVAEATKKNAVAITAYLLEYNNQPKENIPKPPKAVPKVPKPAKNEPKLKDWAFRNLGNGNLEITKYKAGIAREVEIPGSFHGQKIISIGEDSFSGLRAKSCREIEKIVVPEGVMHIKREAFRGCNKLKEIVLPTTLKSIGKEAFSCCWEMESIIIPDSVSDISDTAFGTYDKYLKKRMGCNNNLTLISSKGSYAEDYAIRNKIQFDTAE